MKKTKGDCMFKVGQEVWCLLYGKGKVVKVDNTDAYPITVEFDNVDCQCYTYDGKYHVYCTRTLFFSEPKIEAQEFPSKYVGEAVFLVHIEYGNPEGPFKITKEDAYYIYAQTIRFCKEDYDIYIVEQDKE